ncbi:uroporphyrinogen III cosynthase [Niallia circulans]|jgi:uroporphyrinogen-III synthase|uniref:uroporphyrinogen-III synthase n=1 Tax=Shouchella clausii TaxID=79880 RepID=UPI000BA57B45|nr:uroporphyrinogen-III synthase [Shouchella clausii]MCM3547401.1 uroporphyrinogen-III synthase [Shouchella clausii]PAF15965.1 hypothetical protein CHH59_01360 [Shouchella clausii]PTL24916.1 uroporphyrinogen-III synthase [Shouchella clausii]SPU20886.1 uroporphyrinogen III cosynthase [Niallia circulans]
MKPLKGKHILITRDERQNERWAAELAALGAIPHSLPLIQCVTRNLTTALSETFAHLQQFAWVVFTSANGVRAFFDLYKGQPFTAKVAAVGPKTAQLLEDQGLHCDFIPSEYTGEALAKELVPLLAPRSDVLVVKGQLAKRTVCDILSSSDRQVTVTEMIVYDTICPAGAGEQAKRLEQKTFDYVTLTSTSAAVHYANVAPAAGIRAEMIACIGPVTARAAKQCGLSPLVTASEYTVKGLIDTILNDIGGMKR